MVASKSDLGPRRLSSLRWEITSVIAAAAIIIIAAAVIVSDTLRDQTIDNVNRELLAVSKVTAERTFQTLSAADILTRSIQDLAQKPLLEDVDDLRARARTRSFYESLVALRKLLPQVDAAAVVGADGGILANSRQYPAPALEMAKAGFFRALQDYPGLGLVIPEPVLNPLNGQWMLYLARALTDAQGRFVGIVLVGIRTSYFEGYFSAINADSSFAVLFGSSDDLLIARWPSVEGSTGKPLPFANPLDSPARDQTQMALAPGVDHQLRQIAVTPLTIEGTSMFVSLSVTRAAVLQQWRGMQMWIIVFAGISLAVLVVLTWLVWRAVDSEERWSGALVERESRLSRQAVELAAARDEAERANRVRGQFLANMSHELRTPLNAVLGFSEIMEREIFGPLGDRRYREFVVDIHRSGKHLLEIIGNILDLTKIDAGRLELHDEDVDIADLMRVCGRLVGESATAGGIRLGLDLPDIPVTIRGDPTRLKQIMLNLLSNAVKFTPAGNEVQLSGVVTADGFVITVTDTGIGMTPAEAELAMEPFRQIDNSLARKYEGAGLGLPLTKSLVELHDGTIEIDSAPGRGTRVVVRLPRSRILSAETLAA